jgi:hypothetical protein
MPCLQVDHLMGPRPCLHFLGGQALVALGEADLKPGWTAEFWVLKADIVDRTRYIRLCLIMDDASQAFLSVSTWFDSPLV